ncbi:calcium-binding protein [Nostoc sp. 'Lobaria pulmonaria (5183) cyanobiont']|uniref:calcium-binding protein n=1 Tax=Nostoc sp. 'Lobaria pulmonaria (5183) cyanobiont' TaxID=1618022 RepID=UPI0018F88495|nr:hypothetical protein [Nostoc sp. 'Lobaria pulmonaria (5183) cyanobiont']
MMKLSAVPKPILIHAGDGNDIVKARNGNEIIFGEGGKDTLLGENGNDFLVGSTDADRLNGGKGNDTASYFTSAIAVSVSLTTGTGWAGDANFLVTIEQLSWHSLVAWRLFVQQYAP